jgi:rod shape-determining protein MreC
MISKHDRGGVRTPLYTNSQDGYTYKRSEKRFGFISEQMLFTWLTLAGFILLFMPQKLTNKFHFTFARVFHLPLSLGRNVSLSTGIQDPVMQVVSRGVYDRLQNHLVNVTEQLYQEHQIVEVLSGLRSRFALEGANLVYADVIKASIGIDKCELFINRGENDSLAGGQFVLSDNSIVGTISDVSPRTARVKLFTDPTSKIAIKVGSINTERLIHGSGRDTAKVPLLSIKENVKVGDEVMALKKPGFLGAPVIIGKVTQCSRDDQNPSLWDITVRPVCDMEKLSSISVIIMNPPRTH